MSWLSYYDRNIICKFILLFYERIISENKTSEGSENLSVWLRMSVYKEILISNFR